MKCRRSIAASLLLGLSIVIAPQISGATTITEAIDLVEEISQASSQAKNDSRAFSDIVSGAREFIAADLLNGQNVDRVSSLAKLSNGELHLQTDKVSLNLLDAHASDFRPISDHIVALSPTEVGELLVIDRPLLDDPALQEVDIRSIPVVLASDGIKYWRVAQVKVGGLLRSFVAIEKTEIYADPSVISEVSDRMALLQSTPIDTADVRVLSIVTDRATQRELGVIGKQKLVKFDFSTTDALKAVLKRHKGKHIIVISHIEGDLLTSRDANGRTFQISTANFEKLARDCCQITVLTLGCESGVNGGTGVLIDINSVSVAKAVAATLKTAHTQADVLTQLSRSGFPIVLDPSYLGDLEGRARVRVFYRPKGTSGTDLGIPVVNLELPPVTPDETRSVAVNESLGGQIALIFLSVCLAGWSIRRRL